MFEFESWLIVPHSLFRYGYRHILLVYLVLVANIACTSPTMVTEKKIEDEERKYSNKIRHKPS